MPEAGGSERGSERATGIRSGKMLGKRERSQVLMPRTTSTASLPSAAKQGRPATGDQPHVPSSLLSACAVGMGAGGVGPKRDSGDLAGMWTAAFLKACGICGGLLGPGKDTYIYRLSSTSRSHLERILCCSRCYLVSHRRRCKICLMVSRFSWFILGSICDLSSSIHSGARRHSAARSVGSSASRAMSAPRTPHLSPAQAAPTSPAAAGRPSPPRSPAPAAGGRVQGSGVFRNLQIGTAPKY